MNQITQNSTRYMPVLISACLLLMLSFGLRSGFGLFLQPMSEANGWGAMSSRWHSQFRIYRGD
jgi:hypothetical protein